MTEPMDSDLGALAAPYALDAISDSEREEVDRRLAAAPPAVAQAFAEEVRNVREAMAVVSAATATEPPPQLRERLLAEIGGERVEPVRQLRPRPTRWQKAALAAAAVVVVGAGALGVGLALRPADTPSTAEQVFAAPDVRTVSGEIPGGGTATVVFSREKDAGVLVMNNVTPPQPGTVYQMWLVDAEGPHPAGTMDAQAVAPSTTAVLPDLGDSSTLAFTIEPPGGSAEPTSAPFAELPLA
ncbi:anti-sigma factor [Mycolicibacterium novocastrense]|uniref:anti-sigma factor n=1 Tax=Mycolicibacterium novocastrense TaxID=59813 RepID=UPI000749D252|nr:anti-sigma factor [Mycolicibacterium novocastrense]KUH70092.1 anti-sigma factor [Mycolicibacterium novocastrense]KUH78265.1 anti-sigma factor [Mycolicibacterium novocastrense]KUH79600.1 anti-sigma factor [Mycolicibacterium novocastrense]